MAIQNNLSQSKKQTFSSFIKTPNILANIQSTLGSETRSKTFVANIISAVGTNPALSECEATSIISASLLGESLNLSPSPQLGYYYLVPFNNKEKGKVATFQLGYKGYLQLAIRSGQYKRINVLSIKQGELVSYDALNEEIHVNLIDDEDVRENTETIGYYCMFETIGGFRKSMYWIKSKMESHAMKYSMGYKAKKGYTFWEKDFDGMAYKTMIRQLISKWGIMSTELSSAYENDMSFKDGVDDKPNYVEPIAPTDTIEAEVIETTKENKEVDPF